MDLGPLGKRLLYASQSTRNIAFCFKCEIDFGGLFSVFSDEEYLSWISFLRQNGKKPPNEDVNAERSPPKFFGGLFSIFSQKKFWGAFSPHHIYIYMIVGQNPPARRNFRFFWKNGQNPPGEVLSDRHLWSKIRGGFCPYFWLPYLDHIRTKPPLWIFKISFRSKIWTKPPFWYTALIIKILIDTITLSMVNSSFSSISILSTLL